MKYPDIKNTKNPPSAFLISKRWAAISIIFLFSGLVWIYASRIDQNNIMTEESSAPFTGFKAPLFELQTENGETVSTLDYQGTPLIINLWTSWCPPCRAEMPAMERVYQEHKGEGLEILAVNITNQDSKSDAIQFARELGLTFPVLFDNTGKVSELYHLKALPTTFFVDEFGIIREVVIGGPMSETLLQTRVEKILNVQGNN